MKDEVLFCERIPKSTQMIVLNCIFRRKKSNEKATAQFDKEPDDEKLDYEWKFFVNDAKKKDPTGEITMNGSGGNKAYAMSDRKHDLYPTKKQAPITTRRKNQAPHSPSLKRIKITTNESGAKINSKSKSVDKKEKSDSLKKE